jgi:Rrf2 family iron-sulfur cluster assembly transcriptional regulator
MRLTTKGRFAVTAMLDLALHQHKGPVALTHISQRQNISLSYLEQLFGKLRRGQLVSSLRGPGGGYTLARFTEQITVADIITAVNESLDTTQCGGKGGCQKHNGHEVCMTHELWTSLNHKMIDFLQSVSLKDLVDRQQERLLTPQSVSGVTAAINATMKKTANLSTNITETLTHAKQSGLPC